MVYVESSHKTWHRKLWANVNTEINVEYFFKLVENKNWRDSLNDCVHNITMWLAWWYLKVNHFSACDSSPCNVLSFTPFFMCLWNRHWILFSELESCGLGLIMSDFSGITEHDCSSWDAGKWLGFVLLCSHAVECLILQATAVKENKAFTAQ